MLKIWRRGVNPHTSGWPVRGAPSSRSLVSKSCKESSGNDIDFGDPTRATQGKTTWEVLRGWLVFKIFTYDVIVNNSLKMYNISRRVFGVRLTEKLLRMTVFGQFAGGLDERDSERTVRQLADKGVSSIWFYSVDTDLDEIQSPKNLEEVKEQEKLYDSVNDAYIRSIEMSASCNSDREPRFMAIKMAAIINPVLLSKLNAALVTAEATFLSHSSPGKHKIDRHIPVETLHNRLPNLQLGLDRTSNVTLVDWNRHFCLVDSLEHFSQLQMPTGESITFTDLEQDQLSRCMNRLKLVGEAAESNSVCVLVDAEQRFFQRAIEHLTLHLLSSTHNKSSRPLFYNTLQTYLKDSYESLLVYVAEAHAYGFTPAIKIVRGAYMEHERHYAETVGQESPVHSTKSHTDTSYHHCLEHIMKLVHNHSARILVASHNKETVERAVQLMKEYGLLASDDRVAFGQQLGMADHLTLPLAQAGYQACKVVPYGSLDDVVPYLTRRANENRGVIKNARDERIIYFHELKRRFYSKFK